MPNHTQKDDVQLAYDANKKRLRAEGQIVLARVMNEALHEMTTGFNEALARGEILEIGGSREELRALLLKASQRELGPAPEDA